LAFTPSEAKHGGGNGRFSIDSIFSTPKIQRSVNIENIREEADTEMFNAV